MNNTSFTENLLLILGYKGWVHAKDCASWQRDWLNIYGQPPLGVARPSNTEEVSKVLALCNNFGVTVVPQGGNTGLVGGSVLNTKDGIILSCDRMNTIYPLDESSSSIKVEAGVILENLHNFLGKSDLMFPLHLGSEGTAQIGGLIATNAGGNHAFRYGMMQDLVFGLEVVLPDGSVWDGMRAVQKDNSGYQLRKIFPGSEGTLGVVTKAILKLSPKPRHKLTALIAFKDVEDMMKLSNKLRIEAGEFLYAMEFFSDIGLQICLENIPGLKYPLENRASFYLLVEAGAGSSQVPLDLIFNEVIDFGIDEGIIVDGTIAMSETQCSNLWRLREEQPEGQRRIGRQLKHDISIPPGHLSEFLDHANDICNELLDGIQINSFGHLLDGNVHYNLSPPIGKKDFIGLDDEFSFKLSKLATDMSGSFAAEHGIGRSKIKLVNALRSKVEQDLMQGFKKLIDKKNFLNPGIIFEIDSKDDN